MIEFFPLVEVVGVVSVILVTNGDSVTKNSRIRKKE